MNPTKNAVFTYHRLLPKIAGKFKFELTKEHGGVQLIFNKDISIEISQYGQLHFSNKKEYKYINTIDEIVELLKTEMGNEV